MNVKERAKALNETIVAIRRELHANPEVAQDLPFAESVIVRELSKLGLDEVKSGQGKKGDGPGHGVIATLKGAKPGKVLALRADMDALPMAEDTGLPFAAKNGKMHACGHDAHVAMLIAAAQILSEARNELAGTVRFIFQPAEETLGGAEPMIESGAIDGVDEIIGIHTGNIWPGLKPGQIGWKAGPFMAATTRLDVTFEGKGGHGATPQHTVDPIVMTAEAIVQLQSLVSREISPFDPAVVTIGQIEGGTANNIIPERCKLAGTVRSFKTEVHEFIKGRIKNICEGVASTARGKAIVEFKNNIPVVTNDETCSHRVRDVIVKTLGGEYVAEVALPTSGSEDYAFYLEKIRGAFFFHCGAFEDAAANYPHHHPKFDINESVLWTGTAAMTAYALHWQE